MIHRIRIQNFKSLRDVIVDLSPVTVFIGKTGTGKTNFAAAIRFLRDCLSLSPARALQQVPSAQCATNPSGAIEFEVEFSVPGFTDRFSYAVRFHEQSVALPPHMESLRCGEQTIFRQIGSDRGPHWEVEPPLVASPPPGELAIRRLPGLEEVVVAYTALTAGIGVYAFPVHVLKDSSNGNNVPGLYDDGSNYLKVLRDVTSSLQDITARKGIAASLKRVNPTVVSVELDSLQTPQKAIVGHRLSDKVLPLDLREESDGFRRFYAHLLAIYQMPPKQTLVFEEPENGIYPGALSLLADEFKAAFDAGRGQVLLTTHSPALLDHFSAEQIRVVEMVDLETRIGLLDQEQKVALGEDLLHAGELLTVDPARRQGE